MARQWADQAQDLMAVAEALADAARVETLRYFRSPGLDAQTKEVTHFDPVTVADQACEDAMRAILAARRPQDAILGEERGATRGYLSGTPTWGVLIAVCDADGPVYGVIDQPFIGERFRGGLGRADVSGPMGDSLLRARPARGLDRAILFSPFPEVGSEAEGAAFHALARQVRLVRYGTDCYAYALIAAGQIDLVVEAGLQSYDVCAPIAVIEAAGGIVTNWQGGPAHAGGRILAAANADIHAAALAVLAQCP